MPECFAREARRKFFLFLKKVESYLIKVHRGKIFRGVINLKSRGGVIKKFTRGVIKNFFMPGAPPPTPPVCPCMMFKQDHGLVVGQLRILTFFQI